MKNIKLKNIKITSAELMNATKEFNNNKTYKNEFELMKQCLKLHKLNNDVKDIAIKCGIIDITNSTHLSQYKSDISICDLVKHIKGIKDIDKRIMHGDPTVVDDIAVTGKKNLLSFASKFCAYHNICIYGKDDYSIYDGVLAENLPIIFKNKKHKDYKVYFKDKEVKLDNSTLFGISNYNKKYNYETYNEVIGYLLENIKLKNKRRQFDHLIWLYNR